MIHIVEDIGLITPGARVNSQKNDTPQEQDPQKTEIKKRGRPTLKDKTPKLLDRIYELARQGKTNAQIAESIGISDRTLSRWNTDDLVFASYLKENKELPDSLVEVNLFKRATGYDYTEEQSTREGVVELRRHAPPDPTSMIFWLKNRKSKEWRDRQEIEHNLVRTVEFESTTGVTKV